MARRGWLVWCCKVLTGDDVVSSAGGPATPEETQRLIKVTKELLKQGEQGSARR